MSAITLHHGDCLAILPTLDAQSVDAIIADPPYGQTACAWDSVIPFEAMWRELKRVIKPRGAIVLFASQPFTSALVMSAPHLYRHSWVWDKATAANFQKATTMPLNAKEDVLVFGIGSVRYYPQMQQREKPLDKTRWRTVTTNAIAPLASKVDTTKRILTHRYPKNVLRFSGGAGDCNNTKRIHPSQKSVPLLEYLIRTYTLEGETVLDFCMGSASTAVACINTNRRFIGIERDAAYFQAASTRIAETPERLVYV